MNRLNNVLITLVVLALFLTGCTVAAAEPTPALPEVTIMAHEYGFDAPKEIPAGLVRVKLAAHGKEPHHVQFARLNDGVTFEQFTAALQKGEAEAFPLITFPGGAAPVDPGSSTSVIIDLTVGNYVLLCFVPAPDGLPHLAKGMIAPVTVVESNARRVEPMAQATVKLVDFSFALPTDIQAGKQIWKVVNEGTQPHEINLIKLADGKTLDDVAAWVHKPAGAPPFHNVGGYNALDPKKVGWMDLDLTPGQYIAICHVPDAASGKPHDALGMMLPFTVK